MKPLSLMLIAGEASGDLLTAELVGALREKLIARSVETSAEAQPLRTALMPRFFGAGGPRMAAAGVELAFDLTQHAVIGLSDVLENYLKFRRLFHQLLKLAIEEQPDAIIGVDFGGFNLRFAKAIKNHVRRHWKEFTPWNPKIVQFISPQVWASRPGRAYEMADNLDLLLSLFPFESAWYAKRVPKLRVEFVGHPMVERYTSEGPVTRVPDSPEMGTRVTRPSEFKDAQPNGPALLLLPGSREGELQRHLPVMLDALKMIQEKLPVNRKKIVVPNESLAQQVKSLAVTADAQIQVGGLPDALVQTDVAIASTGTVTLECAFFGVPTVAIYRTSWTTYEIAKRIITVKYLTMPNLLANEEIFPEFVQHHATPENISRAALELLRDDARRQSLKVKLAKAVASLGGPGATTRAAEAIVSLLP